MNAMKQTT